MSVAEEHRLKDFLAFYAAINCNDNSYDGEEQGVIDFLGFYSSAIDCNDNSYDADYLESQKQVDKEWVASLGKACNELWGRYRVSILRALFDYSAIIPPPLALTFNKLKIN